MDLERAARESGIVRPEHVAKLILSDSPGASWTGMVHLLPEVFPDIEEQDAAEEKKLGEDTDAAARAGLRNHFKMIFYSPEKRDEYMAKMGDLGYEPKVDLREGIKLAAEWFNAGGMEQLSVTQASQNAPLAGARK